mmetsp:Transcript_4202/g.15851  ORF Transcript_4202/g.15851 Transcript_4202/m.15851 type:complete len:150 (-) Transcript_4202:173-622(-)
MTPTSTSLHERNTSKPSEEQISNTDSDSSSSYDSDDEELNQPDTLTQLLQSLPHVLQPGTSVDPQIQNIILLIFAAFFIFLVCLGMGWIGGGQAFGLVGWVHIVVLAVLGAGTLLLLRLVVPAIRQARIVDRNSTQDDDEQASSQKKKD